jgi:FlaA1/EpsC-like NDP-sugar epimerase
MDLSTTLPQTNSHSVERRIVAPVFFMMKKLLELPRHIKRLIAVILDIIFALMSVWLAFSLRIEHWQWPDGQLQWLVFLLSPVLMLPIFTLSGLYSVVYRFSGFTLFVTIVRAAIHYGAGFLCVVLLLNNSQVPRSIGIMQPMIFLLITGGFRALPRILFAECRLPNNENFLKKKLLIYGAGSAGVQIANEINTRSKFELFGFVDDDIELHGRTINGKTVFSPKEAEKLIEMRGIDIILLAIPSASRRRRNAIVENFRKYQVQIQMLPGVEALVSGHVTYSDIKEVEIEDLLGRDPVHVDQVLIKENNSGLVVMVTGAGGSIGSELCRKLLAVQPSKLLLVDNGEHNLYKIHSNLENLKTRSSSQTKLIPILGDVTDKRCMAEFCRYYKPKVIYHTAAYKHVPMVENNPTEGVRNNVLGTLVIAEIALQFGVSSVVLVSTDKAVRPTNVMGASKRLCEMIMQALAAEPGHKTCFSMVRFGNVLGSSGSVVPLFRRQIKEGGPISITHKDITRYFMTIPEAAQLVIQAGAMAQGGDVFLLDMGDPVKIIDLARKMVELSGLKVRDKKNPDGDIEIHVTGLRPGEKLYEELLIGNNSHPTVNCRIYKANEYFLSWPELRIALDELVTAISMNNKKNIREILKRTIPEYQTDAVSSDLPAKAVANSCVF